MSASRHRPFNFLFQSSGKLEIALGLRTGVLFAVPLIIGKFTTNSDLGLYIGLAGYPLVLADTGGLYTTRSRWMILIAIAGVASLFLGTLISHFFWLKIIFTFLWVFATGYLAVYGHPGVMAGIASALFFIFAIYLPSGDLWLASLRALAVIFGAMWAMFLCLGMWPLTPYQPLRQSVAGCYRAIANYIQDFRHNYFLENVDSQKATALRQTIHTARDTLAFNRRGRLGRSQMGELSSVLIEDANCLITQILTLMELVEVHHEFSQFLTVNILINDALEQATIITRNIAQLVLNKPATIDLGNLKRISEAVRQQKELQTQTRLNSPADFAGQVALEQLYIQLKKLIKQLEFATDTASTIKNNHHQPNIKPNIKLTKPRISLKFNDLSWLEPLQDNFTFDSRIFRHGLRLAITTTIGVAIYTIFDIPQGFWITLTIILVLQPDWGKTFQRFFHRIIGTVLGVIVAPLLLTMTDIKPLLEGISILSISIALSLLRFHYGIAVFFISIFVILLGSLNQEVENWEIALIRLLCTCIGAGLAILGAFFLFRDREQDKLVADLATAIDCSRRYFLAVMDVYLGQAQLSESPIDKSRKENRLAYFNAQASLQRFNSEPHHKTSEIEPAITLISYLDLFNRSITVLRTQLEYFDGSSPPPQLIAVVHQVEQILVSLSKSLMAGKIPPNLPDLEDSLAQIALILPSLSQERLAELATHQENSLTDGVLQDYTLVGTEFQEMINRLQAMHSAVTRLEGAILLH